MHRFILSLLCVLGPAAWADKSRNVILVIPDGVRWQEVFTGADPLLINDKEGGSWASTEELRAKYPKRKEPDDPAA